MSFDDGDGDEGEETTPVCAERVITACLPCLGRGAVRLVDGRHPGDERQIRCPFCRGAGKRIVLLRGGREVSAAEERAAMKVADTGRCPGSFRAGRSAAFGRVGCPACGARLRPLPGLRVPNHVAERNRLRDAAPVPYRAEPKLATAGARRAARR